MKRGPLVLELLDAKNPWKTVLGVLLLLVVLDGFLFYIGPGGIGAPFNIGVLLWGIITFLIMLGLLYWFVYAPIRDQIRQRQHSGDLAPPPPEKTEEPTQQNPEETTAVVAAPPPQPTRSLKPPPTPQPAAPSPSPASGWADPNPDGNCPSEYPIKGNINSKEEYIYHRPTGRCYSRTNAKVCFATESDAQNAGFRPPRR